MSARPQLQLDPNQRHKQRKIFRFSLDSWKFPRRNFFLNVQEHSATSNPTKIFSFYEHFLRLVISHLEKFILVIFGFIYISYITRVCTDLGLKLKNWPISLKLSGIYYITRFQKLLFEICSIFSIVLLTFLITIVKIKTRDF